MTFIFHPVVPRRLSCGKPAATMGPSGPVVVDSWVEDYLLSGVAGLVWMDRFTIALSVDDGLVEGFTS